MRVLGSGDAIVDLVLEMEYIIYLGLEVGFGLE
jgi:hypothetical protein